MRLVSQIHKDIKAELCGRKGLGWDELDCVTGIDGLEKEIDDAIKAIIKRHVAPIELALRKEKKRSEVLERQLREQVAREFHRIQYQELEFRQSALEIELESEVEKVT